MSLQVTTSSTSTVTVYYLGFILAGSYVNKILTPPVLLTPFGYSTFNIRLLRLVTYLFK